MEHGRNLGRNLPTVPCSTGHAPDCFTQGQQPREIAVCCGAKEAAVPTDSPIPKKLEPAVPELKQWGVQATMGQVCFYAVSSNRACHYGLHCSQFSVPDHVLCVRFLSVQWLGSGSRSLRPVSTVPGQLSPVGLCAWQTFIQAYACVPGDRHAGLFLYRVRGMYAGQGSSAGGDLQLLA